MPVAGNATGRAIDLGASLIKQAGGSDGEIARENGQFLEHRLFYGVE